MGAEHSAMARHSLDLDHRTDLNIANIIFSSNNVRSGRGVEGTGTLTLKRWV